MGANLQSLYGTIRNKIGEKGFVDGVVQGAARRTVEPRRRLIYFFARLYRRTVLRNVVFVGITGSCGKTTTKELTAAAIATRFPAKSNIGTLNRPDHLASWILSVRPRHRFGVVEMAAARDDQFLTRSLRLVAPKIGVVTMVGTDHLSTFGSIEAIAQEKSKLVQSLPPRGTAILNADDPRVIAMAALHDGPVITFGTGPEAMVRGANARCAWPDRLSLDVTFDGETRQVQTQLCGTHLVPSVLAALAAAVAVGVPLDDAIAGVGTVPPFNRRMCPVDHQDGFTFIRDEVKASPLTIFPALDFMRDATAPQKIVVLGTISDYQGSSRPQYHKAARTALDVADHVVFVGPNATQSRGARDHERGDALRICITLDAARDYLAEIIKPGALVLLKGSASDNMRDLLSLRLRPAAPVAVHEVKTLCATAVGATALDGKAPGTASPCAAAPRGSQPAGSAATAVPDNEHTPVRVVAGLGNPGEGCRNTPHNVGHRILDAVAGRLGAQWEDTDGAEVARATYEGQDLLLLKPKAWMNKSGPALQALAQQLNFTADELLLAHDDMDMPLGRVRARLRGVDAGHRGLRSVFETLGTNEVRRIKLGVASPDGDRSIERLTQPFPPDQQAVIDQALSPAVDRVLEIIQKANPQKASPGMGEGKSRSSRKKKGHRPPPGETRHQVQDNSPSAAA